MRFGLLGEKLGHSHSPLIYRHFGIEDYGLFEVPPDGVEQFLRSGGLLGLNVTIPYKKTVVPFCDTLSEAARRLGNVNLLLFGPDGRIHGDNTDYAGFAGMLRRAGLSPRGKKVVVLGTGGAAGTAAAVLRDEGAAQVTHISRKGKDNYENLGRHADAQLLVNATPVGMYPHVRGQPAPLEAFPALEGVLDVVYNPLRTRLILDARARGLVYEGGLYMLAEQGRAAAEAFLGRQIPPEETRGLHAALLRKVENIALVGMPGSGKTTAGRLVAELLSRPFVDVDALVLEDTGRTPAQIIEGDGEAAFRDIEAGLLGRAARESGVVLSTGGGAVLREENRAALRMNSRVYWLRRPLGLLESEGRPLSRDLSALYEARRPLYEAASDAETEVSERPEETARRIVEEFYEYTRA